MAPISMKKHSMYHHIAGYNGDNTPVWHSGLQQWCTREPCVTLRRELELDLVAQAMADRWSKRHNQRLER